MAYLVVVLLIVIFAMAWWVLGLQLEIKKLNSDLDRVVVIVDKIVARI